MAEFDSVIEKMEAYRQGYDKGRQDSINNLQRVIEKICLDINEIKLKIKEKD